MLLTPFICDSQIAHFISPTTQWCGFHWYFHSTGEKLEAYRSKATCPESHGQEVAELWFKPRDVLLTTMLWNQRNQRNWKGRCLAQDTQEQSLKTWIFSSKVWVLFWYGSNRTVGLLRNFSEEGTEERATPECSDLDSLIPYLQNLAKGHKLCLCEWELFGNHQGIWPDLVNPNL